MSFNMSANKEDVGEPMDPSYKRKSRILCGQNSITDDPLGVTQIMVIYCGGTIGMKSHFGVYSPEPNYLIPELRKLPMCHDSSYKLSGVQNGSGAPLVMPLMADQRRIIYSVIEYDPLLDSSNMTVDDYAQIALDIKKYYDQYDGFVILHGTDTMAYTASALSFMLENLGKPVILTGSQIPLFEIRSDGRDNFLGALIIAGNYHIPEVMLYFHNTLLRGNRSTKSDSGAMDAFKSHNMAPLGVTEVNININWSSVYRHSGIQKFDVHINMCRSVGLLRLFPSITLETVKQFLQPPTRGVVLQSYGAGNGPSSRKDLMEALRAASARGVLIVNTTQCARGTVSVTYAAGKALLDCGIIPGSDMTAEASLMKLSYVLGKENWSLEKKRKVMSTNLRGEMTVAPETEPAVLELGIIQKMAETMKISSESELKLLRDTVFPSLLCAAARQGSVEVLQELHSAGADFSLADHDGRTALHIATCEGHEHAVHYMLERGASVHARDRYGHSPLDDAVFFNRQKIIATLRRAGAHLRLPPAKLGMMLCNSATLEDATFMRSWYEAGANLSQGDYDKRTALHLAAAVGNEDIVRYLLSTGVDKSARDVFGRTPLDEAVINDHTNIVNILQTNSNT